MNNNDKREIMVKIDQMIAEGDVKNIDLFLKEVSNKYENYERKFVELILGYVGIYQRDLKNWKPLYEKVQKSRYAE